MSKPSYWHGSEFPWSPLPCLGDRTPSHWSAGITAVPWQGMQRCSRPGQHEIAFNPWATLPPPPGQYGLHVNSELRLWEGSEVRNYTGTSPTSIGSNLHWHMNGPEAIRVAVAFGRQSTGSFSLPKAEGLGGSDRYAQPAEGPLRLCSAPRVRQPKASCGLCR